MGESLNSAKEALRRAVDVLKNRYGGRLSGEALESLIARIQFAWDALVQNEKKIWLRTKKGRELLSEYSAASVKLCDLIESGADLNEMMAAIDDVEQQAKNLNEEIRKRSMVVT
jgi:hypothetical protein